MKFLIALSLLLMSPAAHAGMMDHSAFDEILKRYVDEEGLVDYTGIRENAHSALESYLERLGDVDLGGWPQKDRLAFWINAYNARVLLLLSEREDLKKVSDAFAIFEKPFKVAGESLSANDIQLRILRRKKNPDTGLGPIEGLSMERVDPRIHFALVNGALGGARLRNAAYKPETIERTLQANAVAYINSSNNIDVNAGTLKMSTLFKWYAKDFQAEGGVPAYIGSFLDPDKRMDAEVVRQKLNRDYPKATYDYNWALNRLLISPS